MEFEQIITDVQALLQREQRIAYRMLKRRFALSDDDLEDLKADLIDAKRVATDEDGRVLVCVREAPLPSSAAPARAVPTPASYTPSHLAERIRSQQLAMDSRGGQNGERKTITVLFADLKGSTAMLEGLDPEVARAVYAALRMQEKLRHHSDQVRFKQGASLAMRVGLNTGEVVVRSIRKDDLHTDYVPIDSINLAARMEQIAAPGSILITEYTQKLVEGYFSLKALGAAEIKGVEQPLPVYEVLGVGQLRTRLQVAAGA